MIGVGDIKIFIHWVNDNNFIFSLIRRAGKEYFPHRHFAEKGLSTSRNSKYKPVSVYQAFSVSYNDVFADLIDSVINPVLIAQLLDIKRH